MRVPVKSRPDQPAEIDDLALLRAQRGDAAASRALVALALDLELGTVRSRLSRAKAALRAALEDEHG